MPDSEIDTFHYQRDETLKDISKFREWDPRWKDEIRKHYQLLVKAFERYIDDCRSNPAAFNDRMGVSEIGNPDDELIWAGAYLRKIEAARQL
ncbi:MAG: hypothetical protein ACLQEQ_05685 [Nitrososphaerales archaeon]